LKDAIGKCEGASVVFKTLTKSGQTAAAIAQVAREEDVKHIVMGTRAWWYSGSLRRCRAVIHG
jgi:nucleotide-binding universal stress UspA family protein